MYYIASNNSTLSFLHCSGTLAENNRLTRAQGVVKAYMTIMSAYRGEVPCTVTTATVSTYVLLYNIKDSLNAECGV